jgi:phage terminase large subunit
MEGRYIKYNASTHENKALPKGFIDMLIATYGKDTPLYRQEVLGEDVITEGLVLDAWNPMVHWVKREKWPVQNPDIVIGGIDFGFNAKSAIVVVGKDKMDRTYAMDEYTGRGLSEYELGYVAKKMHQEHQISAFVADSADPRWIRSLTNILRPIPVYPARKVMHVGGDFSSAYSLCNYIMRREINGGQGFFAAPNCKALRREFETLVWKERKDGMITEEVKGKKDCIDAFKYVIMALEHPRISKPSVWYSQPISIGG